MKRALAVSNGGTPQELAKLCGTKPEDRTFQSALADVVELRMLFPTGDRYATRGEVFPAMAAKAGAGGKTIGAQPKRQPK